MTSQTEFEDVLTLGVDSSLRRVYFGDYTVVSTEDIGAFSHRSVELAVRALHRLAGEDAGKPIELHMSSGGGDAYAMLRLYDAILGCPCQVKFFGGGIIMSAATWIMSACDERYLYPNTTVMVHEGSEGMGGTHTDVKIGAAETQRIQGVLYDIYAANTRMPRAFWEDVCQRDLYLTAQEAVALGLADKVLEPKKRGNLRKVRQAALAKSPTREELQELVCTIYARTNKHIVPTVELNAPPLELSESD
jgi:ATP-dependent Clp endopeptidase proteolytic subunit ClpP